MRSATDAVDARLGYKPRWVIGRDERWIVELVIDTGQRMLSRELGTREACALSDEMRFRMRVVTVSMLHVQTGEAITFASHNVRAALGARCHDRDAIAVAIGEPRGSI